MFPSSLLITDTFLFFLCLLSSLQSQAKVFKHLLVKLFVINLMGIVFNATLKRLSFAFLHKDVRTFFFLSHNECQPLFLDLCFSFKKFKQIITFNSLYCFLYAANVTCRQVHCMHGNKLQSIYQHEIKSLKDIVLG